MHKDDAVDIAHNANSMTLEQLLDAYGKFHAIVENTPNWFADWSDFADVQASKINPDTSVEGKPFQWQRSLHGAIGLVTESGEILDAFKKELYGKNRPLRPDNIKEECGDVFFYLYLVMSGMGIDLRSVIQDNVVKLANRYIEKFDV